MRTVVIASLLHGLIPEELLQHCPHLTLAAIHDALSYYYDHREAIDREIAEHEALDPGPPRQARAVRLYLDESVSVALASYSPNMALIV